MEANNIPNIITGHDAIAYAEIHSLTLNKYADPVEDAREGLTIDEARKVAAEDHTLLWVQPLEPLVITENGIMVYHKVMAGKIERHEGGPWFFQPVGYDGDVFSDGYATAAEAMAEAAVAAE